MPLLRVLTLPLALVLALVLALATACGGSSHPDAPNVGALAKALTSKDFSAVTFDGSTPARVRTDYDRIITGLGDLTPKVTAGEPTTKGNTATAELTWSWPVATTPWTYRTTVDFKKLGGEWDVEWAPTVVHPQLTDAKATLGLSRTQPKRGDIIGAHGVHLVTDRPVNVIGIDKARTTPAGAVRSARVLARVLGIDVAGFVKQVKAAGDKQFVEAITYRRGDVPATVARAGNIRGALVLPTSQPLGPTKEFAAPILGTVGAVTAEMVKKDPATYHVGDIAGLSGLESRYDDQLRGSPGVTVDLVAANGTPKALYRVPARPGKPLQITLDDHLQSLAESVLAGVRPASALVALRPSDGAILAAANGPGTGGVNIATYGQAAPGSTFKTADSLALLRAGLKPDSLVDCPPRTVVDGKAFKNDTWYPSSALGRIPLRTAVAQSCNTAMIGERNRVSHADLAAAAASLGFGVDHDTGFPSYFGQVPAPASETEHAAEMIGQGRVLASPMVMAAVIGSIQSGKTVVPSLVDAVHASPAGDVAPITPAEASQLRTLFRGVVTNGTGQGLSDIPGPPVIAKTGTAEFDRNGKRLTHTWMIAAQGDLAVAVYVDEGLNGATTAGPLVERFLRAAR